MTTWQVTIVIRSEELSELEIQESFDPSASGFIDEIMDLDPNAEVDITCLSSQ